MLPPSLPYLEVADNHVAVNQMSTNASFDKSRRLDGRTGPFSHGCHSMPLPQLTAPSSRDINTHAQGGGPFSVSFSRPEQNSKGEDGHISQALRPDSRPLRQATELMIRADIHDRFRLEARRRWIEKTVLTPKRLNPVARTTILISVGNCLFSPRPRRGSGFSVTARPSVFEQLTWKKCNPPRSP